MQSPINDDSLFKYLVHGVQDYAIFALTPSGHVASWNAGAERIKGYTAEEIIGKHFSTFYTEEAIKSEHPNFELAQARANGSYEEQGPRVRKDGDLFFAQVTITALYDDHGDHIGFAKVIRDLTERRAARDASDRATLDHEASSATFNTDDCRSKRLRHIFA